MDTGPLYVQPGQGCTLQYAKEFFGRLYNMAASDNFQILVDNCGFRVRLWIVAVYVLDELMELQASGAKEVSYVRVAHIFRSILPEKYQSHEISVDIALMLKIAFESKVELASDELQLSRWVLVRNLQLLVSLVNNSEQDSIENGAIIKAADLGPLCMSLIEKVNAMEHSQIIVFDTDFTAIISRTLDETSLRFRQGDVNFGRLADAVQVMVTSTEKFCQENLPNFEYCSLELVVDFFERFSLVEEHAYFEIMLRKCDANMKAAWGVAVRSIFDQFKRMSRTQGRKVVRMSNVVDRLRSERVSDAVVELVRQCLRLVIASGSLGSSGSRCAITKMFLFLLSDHIQNTCSGISTAFQTAFAYLATRINRTLTIYEGANSEFKPDLIIDRVVKPEFQKLRAEFPYSALINYSELVVEALEFAVLSAAEFWSEHAQTGEQPGSYPSLYPDFMLPDINWREVEKSEAAEGPLERCERRFRELPLNSDLKFLTTQENEELDRNEFLEADVIDDVADEQAMYYPNGSSIVYNPDRFAFIEEPTVVDDQDERSEGHEGIRSPPPSYAMSCHRLLCCYDLCDVTSCEDGETIIV